MPSGIMKVVDDHGQRDLVSGKNIGTEFADQDGHGREHRRF